MFCLLVSASIINILFIVVAYLRVTFLHFVLFCYAIA